MLKWLENIRPTFGGSNPKSILAAFAQSLKVRKEETNLSNKKGGTGFTSRSVLHFCHSSMVNSSRFRHPRWRTGCARHNLEAGWRRRFQRSQRYRHGLPVERSVLLSSGRRQPVGIRVVQNHSPLICLVIRSVLSSRIEPSEMVKTTPQRFLIVSGNLLSLSFFFFDSVAGNRWTQATIRRPLTHFRRPI